MITEQEMQMRQLVRESDVIDRTDGSELAQAFNYLFDKYIENAEPRLYVINRKASEEMYKNLKEAYKNFNSPIYSLDDSSYIQPIRPRGHWKQRGIGCSCSVCGIGTSEHNVRAGLMNYCPNCGAYMGDKQDDRI